MSTPNFDLSLTPFRINSARAYVTELQISHSFIASEWLEQYELHRLGHLPVERTMALLHPEHHGELFRGEPDPRGARSFAAAEFAEACQSEWIWGYKCPLTPTTRTVADHIFPYSLGGATAAGNRITLCRWHNQVKAADIHFYPWERPRPDWVDILLHRIAARLSRHVST